MARRQQNGFWFSVFKYYLYAFNIASLMVAVALITLTLWIRFDWDFKHYIHELGMYHYWNGTNLLMFTSIAVVVLSFYGCCAAVYEHPGHLLVNSIILGVIAVMELSGAAYLLDHGIMYSKITDWLEERFFELLYDTTNPRAARILRIIQEQVGCCGPDDWIDYPNTYLPVPAECRDSETGNLWEMGCAETFSRFLEPRSGWTAGLSLFLVLIQVLAIIASLSLRSKVKKFIKKGASYNAVSSKV